MADNHFFWHFERRFLDSSFIHEIATTSDIKNCIGCVCCLTTKVYLVLTCFIKNVTIWMQKLKYKVLKSFTLGPVHPLWPFKTTFFFYKSKPTYFDLEFHNVTFWSTVCTHNRVLDFIIGINIVDFFLQWDICNKILYYETVYYQIMLKSKLIPVIFLKMYNYMIRKFCL